MQELYQRVVNKLISGSLRSALSQSSPQRKAVLKVLALALLLLAAAGIWYVYYHERSVQQMTVAFLNIGQGDAIYIESPDHHQIIVDGGPSSALLSELSKVMPFYDRSIDAIMITNPDKDHYDGFLDLIQRYSVGKVYESGTHTDTETYKQLIDLIHQKHIPEEVVHRGEVIHLGNDPRGEPADLTILYPDHDVSNETTNNGSIIARLLYASTSVMLTGDAPSEAEEHIVAIDPTPNKSQIDSDILKEGHHGSRTSASELFFKVVSPEYDVISAGKNNRYGHPHKETIDLLNALHIPTLITFQKGTIVMTSDGTHFTVQYK